MAAKDGSKESQALPPGAAADTPKKKSRAKRIVIFLAILLITLSAAGGAAYWWLFLRSPDGATPESPAAAAAPAEAGPAPAAGQPAPAAAGTPAGQAPAAAASGAGSARIEPQPEAVRSTGIVLPLQPIRVNLTDPSGRRYLTVGMEIEVNSDVSKELKAQSARINDTIIMLLAGKTYGEISTPEGKVSLKHEIAARLNQILGAPRVIRVYFTNFVVE